MSDEEIRVEIGFDGGLIVITKAVSAEWAKLESGLKAGSGVVQFDGDDNTSYHVDIAKVSYVKHETHVGRVGF